MWCLHDSCVIHHPQLLPHCKIYDKRDHARIHQKWHAECLCQKDRKKCLTFWHKRLNQRSKRLAETIKWTNLRTMNNLWYRQGKQSRNPKRDGYCRENKRRLRYRKYSSLVIDIMGIVCKLKLTRLSTIHDLLLTFVSTVHAYHQFGRRNYVFDMNSDDPSVKDNERLRRTNTIPIKHNFVKAGTPLPREMETFWPSNTGKLLLEKLVHSHLRQNVPETWE